MLAGLNLRHAFRHLIVLNSHPEDSAMPINFISSSSASGQRSNNALVAVRFNGIPVIHFNDGGQTVEF